MGPTVVLSVIEQPNNPSPPSFTHISNRNWICIVQNGTLNVKTFKTLSRRGKEEFSNPKKMQANLRFLDDANEFLSR